MKNFLSFTKWYFNYINDKFYYDTNVSSTFHVKRKERSTVVVISYLILISSLIILFVPIYGIHWFSIFGIIISIGFLCLCRFSIIYYFILYKKYINKDKTLNDRIIVEEFIMYDLCKDVRRLISDYYRIVDVAGNIFCLKFKLRERKNKSAKIITLKIMPRKIYFGKIKIAERISDISILEKILENLKK